MHLLQKLNQSLIASARVLISVATSTLLVATGILAPASLAGSNASETEVIRGPEAQIQEALQQELDQAIRLGQELSALEQIPPAERTPEQEQRLLELRQAENALLEAFYEFVDSPEVQAQLAELRNRNQGQNLEPENFRDIQNQLAQLETSAVLYYPLMLEDRLELIVVTADAPPLRRSVEVSRAELNRAIADFRQALEDPRSDVLPPAQQLYQWLIEPIDADLAQANAEAILVAPDGALRYIPLAALHDGEQWLAERFVLNTITTANMMDFGANPRSELRLLAAALSEGPYSVTVGDEEITLSPIPGAVAEVEALATLFPNATVLKGSDFTPEAIAQLAGRYSVLHLATHTIFQPGSPEDSFMLFGNGEIITLRDFRTWNLSNTELVVLSGSDTGMGATLGDGTEILGMGYEFQQAGAEAVMASLWDVSDFGTTELMTSFYRFLNQGYSFAEALQQAQISLISAVPESNRHYQKGSVQVQPTPESDDQQITDYSHPYYWAPFILIGSGL
jgi:CHAT domain-containing protein